MFLLPFCGSILLCVDDYFCQQAKEKLINSLKQGTAGTDASPLSFTELLEVKQERDMLREELQQGRLRVEQLRSEMLVRNFLSVILIL